MDGSEWRSEVTLRFDVGSGMRVGRAEAEEVTCGSGWTLMLITEIGCSGKGVTI